MATTVETYFIVNHGAKLVSYQLEARKRPLLGLTTYEIVKVFLDGSGERLVMDNLTAAQMKAALTAMREAVEADYYDTGTPVSTTGPVGP